MSASPSFTAGHGGDPEPVQRSNTIHDSESGWEDEDDDMEYQPSTEHSEDIEYFEDDEDDDDGNEEYFDGAEDLSGVDVEFTLETSTETQEEEDGDQTETEGNGAQNTGNTRTTQVTSAQIIQMLGANGLRRILQSHGLIGGRMARADDDDEDNEDGYAGPARRRRKTASMEGKFPKVPSENGKRLMDSGIYGASDSYIDNHKKRKINLGQRLMWRELGSDNRGVQKRASKLMSQGMIPSSTADRIIHYDSRCYSGQFSEDGNFFFSCAQDFKVRMYDTSNPYDWKYYKTVDYPFGQWTITDATLSPDNKYLAYSSIRHVVCLAPTDPADHSDPMLLNFMSRRNARARAGFYSNSHFGIWSIRYSGDGREIVAGTSDRSVVVYDIETQQSVLQLQNHEDDVNAVCFGDTSSPHILYSGSDDTTLRVWDRRSMGDGREAGVFMGHTEGLTYIDSKGDGRYVLSNGKDQMMKLWDLRKMMTTAKFDRIDPNKYSTGFDYRFMSYAEEEYQPHPHDCSVVTFRGHKVLKTLIRCHFSPHGSTNSKYVYSGSEDGSVYVYNLDATLAGKIDVAQASHQSRPRHPDLYTTSFEMNPRGRASWKTCVRDASWHPTAPVVAATSWNGWGMATGTCTVHSWNDGAEEDEAEPMMGTSYNNKLEYVEAYNNQRARGATGTLRSRVVRPRRHGFQEDEDDSSVW